MAIGKKVKELLERAVPQSGAGEPIIKQGSSDIDQKGQADVENLGSERMGERSSALAGTAKALPISNAQAHGEKALIKQGSSDEDSEGTGDEEDLGNPGDDRSPGKFASAKAGAAKPLPTSNSGGETALIKQGSSDLATPGQGGMQMAPGQQDEETQAALDAILSEAGLNDEVRAQLSAVFEKAVVARLEVEVAAASETLAEAVEELAEAQAQDLYSAVNEYLNYAVEEWAKNNQLAIENGLRTEIAESFIKALKVVFEDHNIEMPDESIDPLQEALKRTEELEGKLNESMAKTVELTEQNRSLERRQIVEGATRGMTDVDAEKFAKLVEDVEYETQESFTEKIGQMKDRFFAKASDSKTTISEESVAGEGEPTTIVEVVAKQLKRSSKF